MLTIRPPSPSIIAGITALLGRKVPTTLTSRTKRKSSSGDLLGRGLDRPDHPGGVDQDVDPPEPLQRRGGELARRRLVGDVATDAQGLEAGEALLEVVGVLVDRLHVASREHQRGSLLGERGADRASHALGGAGDDGDPAVEIERALAGRRRVLVPAQAAIPRP